MRIQKLPSAHGINFFLSIAILIFPKIVDAQYNYSTVTPPSTVPEPALPNPKLTAYPVYGTLALEKSYYTSKGWTWDPTMEAIGPSGNWSSPQKFTGEDVHGDLESDDLLQNILMYKRTGLIAYRDMAAQWAEYYKKYYQNDFINNDLGWGGCHLFGWGLIEWWRMTCQEGNCDDTALVVAKVLGEHVIQFLANATVSSSVSPYAQWAKYYYNKPGRQVGRHLSLVTELWAATGDAKWRTAANQIVNALLTSPAWDTRGSWLVDRYDNGVFPKSIAPIHFAAINDGLFRYWQLTNNTTVKDKLIANADFAKQYGLNANYLLTGNFIALDSPNLPALYHGCLDYYSGYYYSSNTSCLVNPLMRGWEITGNIAYRDRAYLHWDGRAQFSSLDTANKVTIHVPAGTVKFINVLNPGCNGYLGCSEFFTENGDIEYTYLLFTDMLTGINEQSPTSSFSVSPNPAVSGVSFAFELPESGLIDISIFNLQGQELKRINSGYFSGGEHKFYWSNPDGLNGVFLARISTGNEVIFKKIAILK